MNRETPTLLSERGLSQTAARILARALNLPSGVAWRSAASWDNSRSRAKASRVRFCCFNCLIQLANRN
jgi:hypothetical protein